MFASFLASLVPVLADGADVVEEVVTGITTQTLQPVGNAMVNAATAAIPVGLGVMAVTSGIPIAKKVIKQLGR